MKLKNMANEASELIVGFSQSMGVFDCEVDMLVDAMQIGKMYPHWFDRFAKLNWKIILTWRLIEIFV